MPALRETLTQHELVQGEGGKQTYAGHSPVRARLNRDPLLNRLVNLLAHPFPVKLQSVRYSAVHDDLKPPKTARRHADLFSAHRRLFQTEIPTNEKLCYYKFTRSALGERYLFLASSSPAAYAPPY